MLTRFTVVIILQYIQILSHYVVHLKRMLYVNYPQFKDFLYVLPEIFSWTYQHVYVSSIHTTHIYLTASYLREQASPTKVLWCKQKRKKSTANQLRSQLFLYLGIFTLYVLKTLIQASSDMDLIIWLSFPYTKWKTQANDVSSGIDKTAPSWALTHLHLWLPPCLSLCWALSDNTSSFLSSYWKLLWVWVLMLSWFYQMSETDFLIRTKVHPQEIFSRLGLK